MDVQTVAVQLPDIPAGGKIDGAVVELYFDANRKLCAEFRIPAPS